MPTSESRPAPDLLLAGVIGDPVAHSRSPAMHNAAFAHHRLKARYERWHTPAEELPARIESLRAAHMLGANVTLPHKIAVIGLLDQLAPEVELIGAANTIIRQPDGSLLGANTDAPAVVASLQEDAGYNPEAQSIVILGASGAARAAVFALAHAGAARLIVINRTLERAETLLADLLAASEIDIPLIASTPGNQELPELLAESSLIINATSIGWHGDETPLPAEQIPPGSLVFDMVYQATRLLREAAARGARTLDGQGMLIRQAGLAFEQWTNYPAPIDVMRSAFRSA